MKHIYISALCIVFICVYTIFDFNYIQNFTSEMENNIKLSDLNGYNVSDIDLIYENISNKEAVLNFMINKEHLHLLKEYLTNLKFSVNYSDKQNILIYRDLLLQSINNIKEENINPI
jgi:hypothetical protein